MKLALALRKMSVTEKLRTLEEIWDDLQGDPKKIASPAWHADVLKARAQRARSGRSEFRSWDEVKRGLRRRA